MKQWIVLQLIVCHLTIRTGATRTPIVTLKDGSQVQGRVQPYHPSDQQTAVWEFLGIPYASAPIGPLRFLPPAPVKAWKGVKQATTPAPMCEQKIEGSYLESWIMSNNLSANEDCLYLNVWVPAKTDLNDSTMLPVLIAIHGGGFYAGTSLEPRSDGRLLAGLEKMVVVSIAYRLSIFGFLYSGGPEAPGNVGLLDQLEALKWVHNNIEAFGGDGNRVTLMGLSAGSASASLHAVSPLSQPYFNRLILMSGVGTSPWVITDQKASKKRLVEVALKVGCANKTSITDCSKVCQSGDCTEAIKRCYQQRKRDKLQELSTDQLSDAVRCLRSKTAKELFRAFVPLTDDFIMITFTPVVDGNFLVEHPSASLEAGLFKKADIIVGTTANEGTAFVFVYYFKPFQFDFPISLTDESFRTYLTCSIEPNFRQNVFVRKAVYMEYEKFEYTNLTDDRLVALDEIGTDVYFACDANSWAKRYSESANTDNVFRYVFEYGDRTKPRWLRSSHGCDWPFVFGFPVVQNVSKFDVEMSFRIMRYWANFVRTGNPNVNPDGSLTDHHWPKYGGKENFLSLDSDQRYGKLYRKRRCVFWQNFIPDLHKSTINCSGVVALKNVSTDDSRKASFTIRKNAALIDFSGLD